jgi:uncharacterized protein (TIGR03437 family)
VADFNNDDLPDIAAGYIAQGPKSTSVAAFSVLLNDPAGDGFATTGVSPKTWTLPVESGSVVAAFGNNLALREEIAETGSPTDTLGGIRVHVRDRSHTDDMLAPLLFVSPSQINYILPSSDPFAWIGIEHVNSGYLEKGVAIPIGAIDAALRPLLFSVGDGLAAATAISVSSGGGQAPVAVTSRSGSACVSVPIDLSGPAVFLTLYGTGFAYASESKCSATGQTLNVTYAGPQPQISGLDQVNILLPPTLSGVAEIQVSCQFRSGLTCYSSNFVKVNIR